MKTRRFLPHHRRVMPLLCLLLVSSCASQEERERERLLDAIEDMEDESAAPLTRPVGFVGKRVWSFDEAQGLPVGFTIEATNPGANAAAWQVVEDATAPSAPNAVQLVDPRGATDQTYNLLWTPEVPFLDGVIELAVRSGAGVEDQGGGVAWRIQDKDNYYVARWNPLENNVRVYFVYEGRRGQLASADVELPTEGWHTIRIEQHGPRIVCSLDGRELLKVSDTSHLFAGGVGLWTKADAATFFDDLMVVGEETLSPGR